MYKYKLTEQTSESVKQFHLKRMQGFDRVNDLIGQIQPLLRDARSKTEEYYKKNPNSYAVVYGTDLIIDYLNDIIDTLRPQDNEN